MVISIISILGVAALDRLWFYQEQAEKVVMEQTASILKSALRLQMADLIARQQVRDIPRLAEQNPMDWLAEKPGNYLGELNDPAPGQIAPGSWYFDTRERMLVYAVDHGSHFVPDRQGRKRVRYRVELVGSPQIKENPEKADSIQIEGVKLAVVEPYRWF